MTDWPWEFDAGCDRTLIVGLGGESTGACSLMVTDGDQPDGPTAYLDALDIPEVTGKLWEACGQQPPVMLGRPDLDSARDEDGWVSVAGVQLRESAAGVTVEIPGGMRTLTAAQARQMAAVAVAMADGGDAEPDPAEVDALESALREASGRHDPGDEMTGIARALLLAGWKREARNG